MKQSLKDLEKKLPIWLGKGQAARQPREPE